MKIVYCLNSFVRGGISQVTLVKANALADVPGNDVTLLVLDQRPKPTIPLNPKVHIHSLEIDYFAHYDSNRLRQHLYQLKLKWTHFKRLSAELNALSPDIVISTGEFGCHLLQYVRINSRPMKIREFHFCRNFMDFQSHTVLSKVKNQCLKWYDDVTRFWGYDKIVVLTEEDYESNWQGFSNVVVIPNPLTAVPNTVSTCENKIVIAAGRLHYQKNFAGLIRLWGHVAARHSDWQLQIWGEGWLKDELQQQIDRSGYSESVKLMGFTDQLLDKMTQASLFVFTSEFEGFGLVLVEAMSCGLPVVSYNCPFGPSSIISEGKNGFLIPVHNEALFAQKVNALIDDSLLRKTMGRDAQYSAKKFQLEIIIKMWMDLFHHHKPY